MGKGNKSTPSKKEKKYAANRARIKEKYGMASKDMALEATKPSSKVVKPPSAGIPLPKPSPEHPQEYRILTNPSLKKYFSNAVCLTETESRLQKMRPFADRRLVGVVTYEDEFVTKSGRNVQKGDVTEASGHAWDWIQFGKLRFKVGEKVSFCVRKEKKTGHPQAEKLCKIKKKECFPLGILCTCGSLVQAPAAPGNVQQISNGVLHCLVSARILHWRLKNRTRRFYLYLRSFEFCVR